MPIRRTSFAYVLFDTVRLQFELINCQEILIEKIVFNCLLDIDRGFAETFYPVAYSNRQR